MSEPGSRQSDGAQTQAGALPAKVPLTARLLLRETLTARRAAAIIAAVVMLTGLGFLAVITASVTASLIEGSRRRFVESERDLSRQLDDITLRLASIEKSLAGRTTPEPPDGVS